MLKKTDESVRGLQAAAADSAAAASKAARATEPASPEAVVAASQLELAAYASGVLSYLAEGRDFEALDLSQHVRLTIFKTHSEDGHGKSAFSTMQNCCAAHWRL